MKKYYVFLVALVMAAGLSSFTTSKAPLERFFYFSGGIWKFVELAQSPCPTGPNICSIFADGAFRVLYYDASTDMPVPKN